MNQNLLKTAITGAIVGILAAIIIEPMAANITATILRKS